VVKNIYCIRIRAGTISTKETEWAGKAPPGNIRGKPFGLHDIGSLTGGFTKILPANGIAMVLYRYQLISTGFETGRNVPKTNTKTTSDKTV
jgi:hypothetical protein